MPLKVRTSIQRAPSFFSTNMCSSKLLPGISACPRNVMVFPQSVDACPVNMILSTLLKEGKVDWDHGSEQMLDFIYIEDCVEAIAKISLADHNPHAEYNIGGGEVIPYTRIIDKARKLFPTAPIHVGPGDLGYDNLGALSVQRAFEDFGWKPRFSIEQGMEQYMNWLKNF